MNVALIFGGGIGARMTNSSIPKQFIIVNKKPIIIHTIEQFEKNENIDHIIVVCIDSWIDKLNKLIKKYSILKVASIVPGGKTGQESIYLGLSECARIFGLKNNIFLHDAVRPLISQDTINLCANSLEKYGNAIPVVPSIETVIEMDNCFVQNVYDRKIIFNARAPQCFNLELILEAHEKALKEGKIDFVDSASLMMYYGHKLHCVNDSADNIKITTNIDLLIFKEFKRNGGGKV